MADPETTPVPEKVDANSGVEKPEKGNGNAVKAETETEATTTTTTETELTKAAAAAAAEPETKPEEIATKTEEEETTAVEKEVPETALAPAAEEEAPPAAVEETPSSTDAAATEQLLASPSGRRPRRSRTAAVEAMEAMTKANAKPEPSGKTTKPEGANGTNSTNGTNNNSKAAHQQQQEAFDRLNIGRLVEQNKHVVGTGQYYPHHGRILEQLKQEGRVPERWVVQWEDPSGSDTSNSNSSNTNGKSDNDNGKDVDDNGTANGGTTFVLRRDEWTRSDLEEHDALVEAWQNPFRTYNGRRPEKTKLGQPLKNTLETLRERYHKLVVRDIEHESFGNFSCGTRGKASQNEEQHTAIDAEGAGDLLPTLVLMAALEDALQSSLNYQRARELERQQSEGTETATSAKKASTKKANNLNSHPPLYYTTNPHQYLIAPSREADAEEDMMLLAAAQNPKAVVTPAILAQRVRDGCQWAWSYLQQREQLETEDSGQAASVLLPAPGHASISATALELDAKKAKEALLAPPPTAASEETATTEATSIAEADPSLLQQQQQQQQQRRSIRSGLGERTSLFDPAADTGRRSTRRGASGGGISYAESSYLPEPNPVQKGGRVALWWLSTLEEEQSRQKQKQQKPEEDGESNNGEEEENEEETLEKEQDTRDVEMEDASKDKADAKPKPPDAPEAASNVITGDSYEDAMGGGDDDDNATKDTDDEDFEMSKDDENGNSSDDQLEGVEKERRSLTPVPDLEESEEEEEDDSDEEEEIDEEHAIVWDNPYLTPSVPAILEYLSKPKSISGEDVQKAMDDITLRLRHNRRTTSYGLPVSALEKCDRALLHWEHPDHPQEGNLVLKCVSGETVNELQRLDSQNFGRCKFELEIIGAQEATIQIRKREDFEQRSEEYKTRRQKDRWRFKGIHEGHSIWPSWKEEAKAWIADHVASSSSAEASSTPAAPPLPTTTEATAAPAAAAADDEALARTLAEDAGEVSSRRTGRRSRSSRGGGSGADGGSGGVFYGNQSSMTQKQLMDALIRLVKAQGSGTLAKLLELVADDSSDPLRRIRIALGKILWKRNLLAKLPVVSGRSEAKLLKHLESGKTLLQLSSQQPQEPTTSDLLDYLSHLHQTELKLRELVLKQLGRIPLPVVATAADERLGTLENMDAADFEDPSAIQWMTEGSDWLSKLIYRPNTISALGEEHTPCYWYRITHWSESIQSEADDAEEEAVERRKRFQAAPYEHGGDTLLLTEAQVNAGKKAADLREEQERSAAKAASSGLAANPFATEIGDRITLVALDDEDGGESNGNNNSKAPAEISGRVVGQDSLLDAGDVEYRILVLPDDNSGVEDDAFQQQQPPENRSPFWAVLDVRADDSSYVCQPQGQSKWYSIENQDFHVDSEPYKACQGVLEWLSRQSKAMAFMEPVDPVALGIPSYPTIIKNPMDISTMTEKLENGAYSNIPPGQSVGNSLVCRMLNGPFRKDMELIFDNAMLFNPPDDWISVAAAAVKKSVTKKIDTLAYAAEKKHSSGGGSQRKSIYADEDSDVDMYEYESDHDEDYEATSRRGKRKRSTQARAASNKDEAAARPMEHPIKLHNCLKDGNDLRGRFSGLPLNGYASTYSMPPKWSCRRTTQNTASAETEADEDGAVFDGDDEESPSANEYVQEMADLLALQKRFGEAESSSLRRSSRETRPTAGRRSNRDKKKDAAKKTEGLEYYLAEGNSSSNSSSSEGGDDIMQSLSLSSIPSSRLDVEVLLEKSHEEHYAKLYRNCETDLSSSSLDNNDGEEQNNFGLYSSGSFPPYLGRMVPSNNQHGFTWEIRPPFVVPALRWVLRGLIVSGHLTAIEPMFAGSSGGSSNQDTTAGVILSNDIYYWNPETCKPFEVLDTRVLQRKKRAGKSDGDDSSEDDFEMSEYEKLRAERVARNAERLKALGLA